MYYRDANGIEHEDYNAACEYYGADTPASLAAEDEYEWRCEAEALGVTVEQAKFMHAWAIEIMQINMNWDDIPF